MPEPEPPGVRDESEVLRPGGEANAPVTGAEDEGRTDLPDAGRGSTGPVTEPEGWLAEALAPSGSPLAGFRAEKRLGGEMRLQQRAEEIESRWRVAYENRNHEGEIAALREALRFAKVTGRIGLLVAARLDGILVDAKRGHLHAALHPPRGRRPFSLEKEDEIAFALAYIEAATAGLVSDGTPYVTVGEAYGVRRSVIKGWQRRPPSPEAMTLPRLLANFDARNESGWWEARLALAGDSYLRRSVAEKRKRDDRRKRQDAAGRTRKGGVGHN